MSSPIERFLDRVRAAESRQQREIIFTMTEARDLHADITRLLLKLEERSTNGTADIQIDLRGQDF
jgi:hypothetical protein